MAMAALLLSLTMTNAYALHHKMGNNHDKCPLFSEDLKAKLNLNDEQQQAWENTKNQIKDLRTQNKDKFKADLEAVKSAHEDLIKEVDVQSQADQPDIQAIISAKQNLMNAFQTLKNDRKELYEKTMPLKVALFNQLTPDQQKMVLTNLKDHMEKMKERMKKGFEKMKDMMEDQDGDVESSM